MLLISICTILCILVFFVGTNKQYITEYPTKGFNGEWKFSIDKKIIISFAVVLILVSTMRYGWIDTYAYKEMYTASRGNLGYVNSTPYGVEAGWLYFCYFLNFFSASPKLLLFVSAIIIISGYIYIIQKFSCDPIFSLIIFYCILYMDTNNGLRQMAAASILIMSYPLLMSKKLWKYIAYMIIALIAMQFHTSASVCILVAIVVIGRPFNNKVKLAMIFGIIFCLSPGLMNQYIGDLFSDSKYLYYLDMSGGMTFLRAFITGIFPAILAILYLIRCKRGNIVIEHGEGILINTLFVNSMFILMGVYMQYWNRMGFYTAFAPIVLMPKLVYELFIKEQRRLVKALAILCYFLFFAYNIYVNIGYGAISDFYISWN